MPSTLQIERGAESSFVAFAPLSYLACGRRCKATVERRYVEMEPFVSTLVPQNPKLKASVFHCIPVSACLVFGTRAHAAGRGELG